MSSPMSRPRFTRPFEDLGTWCSFFLVIFGCPANSPLSRIRESANATGGSGSAPDPSRRESGRTRQRAHRGRARWGGGAVVPAPAPPSAWNGLGSLFSNICSRLGPTSLREAFSDCPLPAPRPGAGSVCTHRPTCSRNPAPSLPPVCDCTADVHRHSFRVVSCTTRRTGPCLLCPPRGPRGLGWCEGYRPGAQRPGAEQVGEQGKACDLPFPGLVFGLGAGGPGQVGSLELPGIFTTY